MNMFSTKISAMFFATIIACAPISASENASIAALQQEDTKTQETVVWYKKRSTQVVASLAAAAVGLYVLAVYKDKVASPAALFAGLFGAKVAQGSTEVSTDEKKDVEDLQEMPKESDLSDETGDNQQETKSNEPKIADDVMSPQGEQEQNVQMLEKNTSMTDVINASETETFSTDFSTKFAEGMKLLHEVIEVKKKSFVEQDGLFVNQYL